MKICSCCCSKTAGLAILAFCTGVAVGLICPPAFIAVLETALLIFFGYLCLFKW